MLNKVLTLACNRLFLSNSLRFTLKAWIVMSYERFAEMNVDMRISGESWNHFGFETAPIRVATGFVGWPDHGPGWVTVWQAVEKTFVHADLAADCILLDSGKLAAFSVDELAALALPLVLALPATGAANLGEYADIADGFVFAGDDDATIAAVFARAVDREPMLQVRDLSDGTARTINALSAEASRIADALMRLAEEQRSPVVAEKPVDATLIRRLLRVRRDRDRFFPAEIFADPAWDMLLDLTAAQLEGKNVPVSSLCIAAAVPTTTALRWIRSLTEAGLFERRVDPMDARRTYISLSGNAASAMLSYLRLFGGVFALR